MAAKKLPHNTEAEKAVLGAMIRSNEKVSEALARLDESDFFEENENHRAIFGAIYRLYTRGTPVDPQTITNELINSKQLEVAGGPEYLAELADTDIIPSNFEQYVKMVYDQSLLRQFLTAMDSITSECCNKDIGNISDFLQLSEKKITDITTNRKVGDFQKADEVAKQVSYELSNLKTSVRDDEVIGTATGFPKLNILTHGFRPGEFIVLAARPAVGKTALALNLLYNATFTKGKNIPVAYFSLEMPATMLFKRLIAAEAQVDFNSLITGFGFDNQKRLKVAQACEKLATKKIYVDDTAGIKLLDLVAKCKKLKAKEEDLGLIVVDYIGLVTTPSKSKSESRQLEVQMVSQTLKKLALDLQVPVIGVAQLNRNVEQRNGGEPQLSDLRESGSIEQDADIVMMLQETKVVTNGNALDEHNNQVEQEKNKAAGADGKDTKLVTLFVRKNRSGRTGDVQLMFNRNVCKFDSLSQEANQRVENLNSERTTYLPRGE